MSAARTCPLFDEPPVPVVETISAQVEPADRPRIDRAASALRLRDSTLEAPTAFGRDVVAGALSGPCLVLDNHFDHLSSPSARGLEYRMLGLARPGDLFALPTRRHRGFEEYLRAALCSDPVEVLRVQDASPGEMVKRCAKDPLLLDAISHRARDAGALTILPYRGSGSVWVLARVVSDHAGVPVSIASSPPGLTRRANDKLWFARLVATTLGRDSMPPTHRASSGATLASRVRKLSREHDRVVVKLADCSGSAGNLLLSSRSLEGLTLRALRDALSDALGKLGWHLGTPLMVEAWESPVLLSPSVQMWIPSRESGGIVIEGVYEQLLHGPSSRFVGAEPVALPRSWIERLAYESSLLGAVLQELGYYGRCSLDAILIGDDVEDVARTELHWVECNGRWGGTSIPMTIVNRLSEGRTARPFVVVQRERDPRGSGVPFSEFLELTSDRQYSRTQGEGTLFTAPDRIESGSGLDFITIAPTRSEAHAEVEALVAQFG